MKYHSLLLAILGLALLFYPTLIYISFLPFKKDWTETQKEYMLYFARILGISLFIIGFIPVLFAIIS